MIINCHDHLSIFSRVVLLLYTLIFFFNDTATTEIYTYLHTLSLHDALPIYVPRQRCLDPTPPLTAWMTGHRARSTNPTEHQQARSEEHTSELQSLMSISYAVFCLKQKKKE